MALADCAGEVLGRDRLLERVWQNKYVSDDVITQAIGELRRALGDDFRHPRFVETVPRRGYRLLQTVRHPGRDLPSEPGAGERQVHDARGWPLPRTALASIIAIFLLGMAWVAIRTDFDAAGDIVTDPLLPESSQRASGLRPTHDTQAYEFYLKARQKFGPHRAGSQEMDEALGLARQAVERDPGFAEAYALIAEIQTFRGFWNFGPREEILMEARDAAKAALAIDPGLSYPHAVSGLATAVLEWKWEEGYRQAAHATELDPHDGRSLSLRAMLSLTRGKSAEAVQLAYRAYELNPIDPHALGILSWVLYQARQYDQAAEFMAKTLEVHPDARFARNFRPLALAYAGRHDEALAAERARSPDGSGNPSGERLALLLVLGGRREEARQHLTPPQPAVAVDLTQHPPTEATETVWAYFGKKEILFERLDRMVEKRMTNYVMWLRTGPAWDPVRGDPRFEQVLQRIGLID